MGFVGLAAGAMLAGIIKSYTLGIAQERMSVRLRADAFKVLINQEASYYDASEHARGTLTSHLATDPMDARGLLFGQLNTGLQGFSLIATGCIVALYFCPRLGGLMLGISPITAFSG